MLRRVLAWLDAWRARREARWLVNYQARRDARRGLK